MQRQTKKELFSICEQMGLKSYKSKRKDEIIDMINKKNNTYKNAKNIENKNLPVFEKCLSELSSMPRNNKRKFCTVCGEKGHNRINKICPVKMKYDESDILTVAKIISNISIFEEIDKEKLATSLNMTISRFTTIYSLVPEHIILNRNIDMKIFDKICEEKKIKCHDCKKPIVEMQEDTSRIWKDQKICDSCWSKSDKEEIRKNMWLVVHKHTKKNCDLCKRERKSYSERYHLDHINMFTKEDSVSSMINKGVDIKKIIEEVDKCTLMCVECHHKVSYIEKKMGFTKIKQNHTRKLNNQEITPEQYEENIYKYHELYEKKMKYVYSLLRE